MSLEPLMRCCLCENLLQTPVQLICLHNCCQRCFTEAASRTSSRDVGCGACSEITPAGAEESNRFIDHEVRLYSALAGTKMCSICKEDRQSDQEAVEWCPSCRHALCEDCLPAHRRYNKNHRTQSFDNLGDSGAKSLQSVVSACPRHEKLLELACFDCEKEICVCCWEDCSKSKHEVHALCNAYFDDHVGKLTIAMSSMENELLRRADVLKKPKRILTDLKAARNMHLQQIEQRKRRILEAVEVASLKIADAVRDTFDELEKQASDAAVAADSLLSNLTDARRYLNRLLESNSKCDIFIQHNIVRKRLADLSNKLDSLSDRLETVKEPHIGSTMPDDLEFLIEEWTGILHSAFTFGEASANHTLPFRCEDIALTNDGHLLLAAVEHGLIELCSETGRELSRWLPPEPSYDDSSDQVEGVASLSDGRAAVSLAKECTVVLLRRSEEGDGDDERSAAVWIENRRCHTLPFVPGHLSAHGDMLAVADVTDGYRYVLQLMCISSMSPLTDELHPDGGLGCLTLAARFVVVGSKYKVKLGGDRQAHVLDSYRLPGGQERQWRHELSSSDEELCGVCADLSGGCLYAAVQSSDRSDDRVTVLRLEDGSEMQRFALSFHCDELHPLLRLGRLSLREDRAAEQQKQSIGTCSRSRVLQLAALCWDSSNYYYWSRVTVYRSKPEK